MKWDRWDMHNRVCIMTDNLIMTGRRSLSSLKEDVTVVKDGTSIKKKAAVVFSELGSYDIEAETLRLRIHRTVQDLSPEERELYIKRPKSKVRFNIRHNIEEL